MDNNSTFRLTDVLLPYQKAIVEDQSRFICLCASRQVGKSFTLAAKAVIKSLAIPKNLTVLVSVNLRSSMELLKKAVQWAEAAKISLPNLASYSANSTQITFQNGSRIISLPAKPESLRGFSGDVILDEAAMFQDDSEIFAAVLPIISNSQRGIRHTLSISSTPKGTANKFASVFLSDDPTWSRHKITIDDATSQGLNADIRQLKAAVNDEDVWNQEYMCSFQAKSGLAFDYADIKNSLSESKPGAADFFLGMDIGRSNDRTAIAVIARERKTQDVFLVFLKQYPDMPFKDQFNELKATFQEFGSPFGLVDKGGIGMQLAEEANTEISHRLAGHSFSQESKARGYAILKSKLQANQFKVPKEFHNIFSQDLTGVQKIISNDGKVKIFQARSGSGHCDAYSAITLALLAMSEHPIVDQLPQPAVVKPSAFGYSARSRLFR